MLFNVVTLLALAPSVLAAITDNGDKKKRSVVPGGYIVEFEDVMSIASDTKSSFYSDLSDKQMNPTHRMDLSSSIFKGLSFHVDTGLDQAVVASDIQAMPIVRKVWPISLYDKQDFATAPWTNGSNSSSSSDTFSTHIMGHVDRLHAEGLTGNGTFVAIIDTGIDYNHPALGGCFGPGCKVAHGYDLVGDNYDGTNIPVPDPDPYSGCNEHGTHVAGIVAAGTNPYNFTGVAPDATLGAYRVFGCSGSSGDDVLIDAFTRAYEDGADIITASIGGPNGWTEEPWTVVVSRIVAAGTPCTLAAGNDGSEGLFYGSSAADGIGVIAVGSIDNIESPVFTTYGRYSIDNSTNGQFGYLAAAIGMPNVSLPLWAVSKDSTNAADACEPLPADTADLSGKLVLIRRGTCTFDTKAANVAAFGAQYILFYNNAPSLTSPSVTDPDIIGAAMVSADQGVSWAASLAAGSAVQVSIDGKLTVFSSPPNNVTGGHMSTFSMWNPTNEAYVKPEISAPGGNILSTLPLEQGGYGVLSGTSMATPFVAGVVALMKQARPDLDPYTIRSILGTTGHPVTFNDGKTTYNYLAPVVQQGGGEVDAFAAVHTSTVIDVANLAFNDTAHFVKEANFTITNRGSSDVTYNFDYVNAATAYTLPDDGSTQPQTFPPDLVTSGATVHLSSGSLSVAAGKSEVVIVTLELPKDLATARIPVYSGFIDIKGSNGDSLSLPYAGVASSLKDATVLDPSTGYPYITSTSDNTFVPLNSSTVFTISIANTTINGTTDNSTGLLIPNLRIGLVMPSSLIRADLIPSNSTLGTYTNTTTILGVKTLGAIAGTPSVYQPRANAWSTAFYGVLDDGTRVAPGTYSILVRALRIFGDATNPDDYDSAQTDPFTIRYVH
ncbi:subtilisin-like protein [Aureobasidium namibiae CBS 147.97]|uniref:Subtilisin-like protein n=1 Tax=Aureobasidium namibiae CBS 147.97 TaxID=1043004 RepID=A0A074WHN9_9PEZI